MMTMLRLIALLQIVGSAVGVAQIIFIVVSDRSTVEEFVLLGILLLLYSVGFVAGVLLWKDQRWGRRLFVYIQAFQAVKIMTNKFAFMISFGPDAAIFLMKDRGSDSLDARIMIWTRPFHMLYIDSQTESTGVGVSVIALVLIGLVIFCRKDEPKGKMP